MGFSFEVVLVRENRRSVRLTVSSGKAIVQVPQFLSEQRIEELIFSRRAWIEKAIKREAENAVKAAPLNTYQKLMINGEYIDATEYFCRYKDKRGAALRFYKNQFTTLEITARRLSEASGLKWNGQLKMSHAASYWGLCRGDNTIALNIRLVMLPAELQEYVILHELTHTLFHDHSSQFWRALTRFLPDAKARRRELKNYDYLTMLYRREKTAR